MIVFDDNDRRKIAAYCHEQAEQHSTLAKEIESLGESQFHAVMAKKERAKALAFNVVAAEIDPESYDRMET